MEPEKPIAPEVQVPIVFIQHNYLTYFYDFYLYTGSNYIDGYKGLISAIVLSCILGVISELLRFLKWYVSIKDRVTNNSLQ